jgi:phenol hydroxylase P1 protein
MAALDDDAHHALEAIAQAFDARIAKQGVEVSHG